MTYTMITVSAIDATVLQPLIKRFACGAGVWANGKIPWVLRSHLTTAAIATAMVGWVVV